MHGLMETLPVKQASAVAEPVCMPGEESEARAACSSIWALTVASQPSPPKPLLQEIHVCPSTLTSQWVWICCFVGNI